MKDVLMMMQATCPYCRRALGFMDELKTEHPEYAKVNAKIVDENIEREFADSLDYWYVPTYYVDGVKLHEGVPTKEAVAKVYEAALT